MHPQFGVWYIYNRSSELEYQDIGFKPLCEAKTLFNGGAGQGDSSAPAHLF